MRNEQLPGDIGRRALLRSVSTSLVAGIAVDLISVTGAESETTGVLNKHEAVDGQQAADATSGTKAPLYFSGAEYRQLRTLCELIIPSDNESGGAIEAGVPEFIDLLTSENKDYQRHLSGGMAWLNALCINRFGQTFVDCPTVQQKEILQMIAFRPSDESTTKDDAILAGIEFFALLRDLTLDGFFTSKIGIEYLDFRGNRAVARFTGCPV